MTIEDRQYLRPGMLVRIEFYGHSEIAEVLVPTARNREGNDICVQVVASTEIANMSSPDDLGKIWVKYLTPLPL